jgi:hypothetical protein
MLIVGVTVVASLAVWLVVSLFDGRFALPSGALLFGALVLFVLAMLPFFFDMGSTLIIPLRMLIQKKGAKQLIEEDRPRSETGITLTFLFFVSGLMVLLIAYLLEKLLAR